ncbi:MAG: hypothetical protein KDD70_14975 [Bdellovibrionales bacterium]|nr:hypothetical protein [Bdellovibrionales bacterium]
MTSKDNYISSAEPKGTVSTKKGRREGGLQQLFIEKAWKPLTDWYSSRIPREQMLIAGATVVALFIGLYTLAEKINEAFDEQYTRLDELEKKLSSIPLLLRQYNQLENHRLIAEQQFARAGGQSLMGQHIESVIERKVKIPKGDSTIRRQSELSLGDQFVRIVYSVSFTRISPSQLADFFKEISSNEEKPAIISKLNVISQGDRLRAELNVELVAKRNS